jgi:hypothetical protein
LGFQSWLTEIVVVLSILPFSLKFGFNVIFVAAVVRLESATGGAGFVGNASALSVTWKGAIRVDFKLLLPKLTLVTWYGAGDVGTLVGWVC